MKEYYMPNEMLEMGDEFHTVPSEFKKDLDEFAHGIGTKKVKKKSTMATARKMFYLLAGSAAIASIGWLAK